ncbi:hypothetical protein, variant 1 [Aphanomyces astaci]|uniref:Tudor domain-containing protein n=1 Tax=Aphanomyces astaci TaxID=112090 RepID=W4FM22_APHAT|nr:hypothetical protein, variant 1 [Aphanomyces astaci]ETV67951.1 hypothetical protein, variant 1 [Aphanomyces astaci]|eukprot:XP_009842513.1 hypothetical protein, variant 1 [Aphanomyces astaci]
MKLGRLAMIMFTMLHDDTQPATEWKAGQAVQVQSIDDADKWSNAKITRVHRNGNVTVTYHPSGEKEKNIAPSRLEKRKKVKRAKREAAMEADTKDDDDDESDAGIPSKKSKPSSATRVRWQKHQAVVFQSADGRKTGRLTVVRDDDCDVQHDSDKDHESTHVLLSDIHALRWWHRWNTPKTRFKIQARVRYVDGKGRPHDGVVTKRHRDNSYDIRHLSDEETQVEHVEAADIKSLSVWLQAIDSLGRWVLTSGTSFAVGTSVEFQLDDAAEWIPGTIHKVRPDGKYNIAYIEHDDDDKAKVATKIRPNRVRKHQSFQWTRAMLALSTSATLQDGTRVEVTCIKDEAEVFKRGEIVRTHADETKSIRYDDGKVEKHVLPSRLRPLATALCVGTLVDVTVETNHTTVKCAAPKQGTIAWVHRDFTRVVLAIHSNKAHENEEEKEEKEKEEDLLYCPDIPVEALRLQGTTRLDTTSLRGYSLWRQFNMLGNFALDALVYGWFLLGLGNEIAMSVEVLQRTADGRNDAAMQAWYHDASISQPPLVDCLATHPFLQNTTTLLATPPYLLLPEILMGRYWLIALVLLKALAFAFILVRALRILVNTGNAVAYRAINLQRHAQDQIHQAQLWRVMFGAIVVSSGTLLCFGSLANTLGYYCLLDQYPLDLTYHTFDFSTLDPRFMSNNSASVGPLLVHVTATTTFNLYRGVCFLFALVASPDLSIRVFMMVPAIAMTAVAWALVLTSMQLFLAVEHDVLWRLGHLGLTPLHDMALWCIVAATWLSILLFQVFQTVGEYNRLVAAHHLRGASDEVAVKQAEEGMLGVHAQEDAVQIRTEEMQIQVGILQAISATLVPGIGVLVNVLAVFWLLIGVSMLYHNSQVDIPPWMVGTSVPLTCAWLLALTVATFLSCCKERKSWKLLKQAKTSRTRPPVLLP